MNTRKPNCGAVLIMRTTQPITVFGFSQAIEKLEKSEPPGVFSGSSVADCRACRGSPKSATAPPIITIASEHQKVRYWPRYGMMTLAKREPRVGSPALNANQNHPTAEPRRFAGVAF